MNLKPIINEMRAYWLEGQTGGQILLGGFEAHYDTAKTPKDLIVFLREFVIRKRVNPISYWEIQAEERSENAWS